MTFLLLLFMGEIGITRVNKLLLTRALRNFYYVAITFMVNKMRGPT